MIIKKVKRNPQISNLIVAVLVVLLVMLQIGCSEQQAGKTLSPSDYPEYNTSAAKLYLEKCGNCHAAPLPSIHSEKQWFGVVQRMQLRMTNKAIKPLNQQESAVIIDYLRKHATKE